MAYDKKAVLGIQPPVQAIKGRGPGARLQRRLVEHLDECEPFGIHAAVLLPEHCKPHICGNCTAAKWGLLLVFVACRGGVTILQHAGAIAPDHYRLGNAARTGFNDQSLHGAPRNLNAAALQQGWSMRDRLKPTRFQTPAWLLLSCLLGGGPRRSLAAAAGMMTVAGISPAFAQCYSAGAGLAGSCNAIVPTGPQATAVGPNANATGGRATAFGSNAMADGDNATATGTFAIANGDAATAMGDSSAADGLFATAIGQNSQARGSEATATGANSIANGTNATATGRGANAVGIAATATGAFSRANGDYATATGLSSLADGTFATATGRGSGATGTNATATGAQARANGVNATATGQDSIANGATASAYGQGSNATGDATTAIGQASTANATGATAVGASAQATGTGAVAVGNNSAATGTNATAIGPNASATFANSTAIGNGASTTAVNQVSIGTSSNTYRMAGIASAASLAAQSGPTSIVTTDANGNLAAAPFSTQDISSLQTNVSVLQGNVATLQTQMRQAFEGTAIAIAMGGSALPSDKKFAISTNWGTFRGQNAMSLGAQMRLNDYVVLNGGVAAGFAQGGVGGRAGLTVAW
ncbi:YadA-like family protein [Bradyrhizobium japonicum]|uniref:YadA-like family protein n=1 Tax=Bradyrhizobium japonicum TaxID=375 RepID=UPI001BA942AF|nr:YadA-like family protein [Bradyrhizobium japonicum]MBR0961729.1 YadA-like family protein [Bradyrhizobium japonicum]